MDPADRKISGSTPAGTPAGTPTPSTRDTSSVEHGIKFDSDSKHIKEKNEGGLVARAFSYLKMKWRSFGKNRASQRPSNAAVADEVNTVALHTYPSARRSTPKGSAAAVSTPSAATAASAGQAKERGIREEAQTGMKEEGSRPSLSPLGMHEEDVTRGSSLRPALSPELLREVHSFVKYSEELMKNFSPDQMSLWEEKFQNLQQNMEFRKHFEFRPVQPQLNLMRKRIEEEGPTSRYNIRMLQLVNAVVDGTLNLHRKSDTKSDRSSMDRKE